MFDTFITEMFSFFFHIQIALVILKKENVTYLHFIF